MDNSFKQYLVNTIDFSLEDIDKNSSDKKTKKNKYKKLLNPIKWREYLQYANAAN